MGGGAHAHRNENNMKESDEAMLGKIQLIELIKHNPNHFHMEFFSTSNMYQIFGGAPAMTYGVLGSFISLAYLKNQLAHRRHNYYAYNFKMPLRFFYGFAIGLFAGYMQFGDRQRLHNAFVAERLRRRYPESMSLHATDLWSLKGVQAPQDYYKWQ